MEWWWSEAGVGGTGELVFNDVEFAWEDGKVLEVEGGNGCTTVWVGMMLPNCMLEMVTMVNSMLSIFYVIYMLTIIF